MDRTIAALLTAGLAGLPAYAQTPPAENLLVTATRVPTPIADISAGVTVIDRAEMDARGYTTLAEALSAVPGAVLVPYGGPGNASLFLRGTNSNQVQMLIDGAPVNDPSGPGGGYNFGVETLAGIARIEVVRGPMSAVYGSGAIGGVVNIITERGTGAAQGEVTVAAGLPAALLGQADLRGRTGRFDWNLNAETQSARGFDATPQRESTYTGERDGFRSQVGAFDVGYMPVDGTRVFVGARGRTAVYGYDDVGYPTFDDPDETGRDNDLFTRAGIDSAPLGTVWRTSLIVAHDQHYRRYVNLLDAADPNATQEDSRYLGRRTDVQWNNTVALPRGATLTAGYEHVEDAARQRLDAVFGGFPYLATVAAHEQRNAGYAGVQGHLGRLALDGTLREEAVSGVGGAFTWRAGGSYALGLLHSHVKGSIGTAFLAPSLYDRFGVESDGYVSNPALRPERNRGYEIGWSGAPAPWMTVSATWFHTRVTDLIQTQFVPVYTSLNVAAARLQGVETAVHVQPTGWLEADATYTFTDARDAGTATQLLRRPYDSGSLTVAVRPMPDVSIVPQVTWRGGDLDLLVDNAGYPTSIGRAGGGATLNLNVAWQARPHVRFFVWGKNLNESRAESASGFAQPGASFLAGLHFSQ